MTGPAGDKQNRPLDHDLGPVCRISLRHILSFEV
jgi:hypothetical protein